MDAKIVIFLRKDHTNKDGTQGVYLRLYTNNFKKKKDVSLDININPECWDEKECLVTKKDPLYLKTNQLIEKKQLKARQIILDAEINEEILTSEEFIKRFKGSIEKESFIEFSKRYYNENPQNLSKETIRTYNTDISELNKYKSNVSFKEINQVAFISNYEKHLAKNGASPNTIYKKLKLIRAVLKIAKKQKLITDVAFDDYSIKFHKTDKVYFTKSELEKIENLLNDNTLKIYQLRVLEYFLFGCYTGLRISDISNLKYSNIIDKEFIEKKENKWITKKFVSIRMQKTENSTGEIVEIPLMEKALMLIGKGTPESTIFNVRENAAEVVKEIVKAAGILKNANFHSSRHTFAVLFLASGGDIYTLSKLLGHSSLKSTLVYAKIVDESKIEAIDWMEKMLN